VAANALTIGILWEMSELITQERIAVGSTNFVEGLTTCPPCMTTEQGQKVKGQRHNVTYQQQQAYRYN